jgi:predicted nuclease with TOPRIM domain
MRRGRKTPQTIRELGVLLEEVADEVRTVAEGVELTNERLDRFEKNVDERFDRVDERFKSVDERFDRVDERFKSVDERFDRVDERFNSVEGRLDRIGAELVAIRSILGTPEKPNVITREEFLKLERRLAKLEEAFARRRSSQSA